MSSYAERQARVLRWRALSPNKRRLIASQRPDCIEEDASLRADTLYSLEEEFGRIIAFEEVGT